MNRQYTCRRANGLCQISKDERYLCRLCRYNKCLALGMTADSIRPASITIDYEPQGGSSQETPLSYEAPPRPDTVLLQSHQDSGIHNNFKPDANVPNEPLMRMHHALLRHRRGQRCAADPEVNELRVQSC
ncbi:zinc finger, C4 type [Cooperia oncophora]